MRAVTWAATMKSLIETTVALPRRSEGKRLNSEDSISQQEDGRLPGLAVSRAESAGQGTPESERGSRPARSPLIWWCVGLSLLLADTADVASRHRSEPMGRQV